MEVTEAHLLAFIGGKADKNTKKLIADELQKEGSFVRTWLERLWSQSGFHPTKDVAWGQMHNAGLEEDESCN